MALNRRISNCLIGGSLRSFLLQYKKSNLCVSEILREGCQVQRFEQSDLLYNKKGEVNFSLQFPHKIKQDSYCLERMPQNSRFSIKTALPVRSSNLGKIIERRRKESGDNLEALLSKA